MYRQESEQGLQSAYRLSAIALMVATQAAGGTIFSFRWAPANPNDNTLCLIQKFKMSTLQIIAATATIFPRYEARIARAFTASDSAGTAFDVTGNNEKKRTSFSASKAADIRASINVTAGLTVGARTLDAHPFLSLVSNLTITTPNPIEYVRETDLTEEHPLILARNEGIVVTGPVVIFGAAGQSEVHIEMSWSEVGAF